MALLSELVYFVCKSLDEAQMRVGALKRSGVPARIVRNYGAKTFEVRIPRKKEYDLNGSAKWKKLPSSQNHIWKGPTKKDLEELEESPLLDPGLDH